MWILPSCVYEIVKQKRYLVVRKLIELSTRKQAAEKETDNQMVDWIT